MSVIISGWFGLTLTILVGVLTLASAIEVDGRLLSDARHRALLGVTAILMIGWFVVVVLRFLKVS